MKYMPAITNSQNTILYSLAMFGINNFICSMFAKRYIDERHLLCIPIA